MNRKFALSLMIATSFGALPLAAHAEWQPKGPITMMIAFAAGGGADTQARLIAEELEIRKGWKVIPESVLGKGGGVLAARLMKQPADGTAIGMAISETTAYAMLAEKNPGYSDKDFTFLTTTAGTQMGIVAKKSRGWKSMADVSAAIKKGEKISFGVMSQKLGDGAYLLSKTLGVKYNIVTLKGGKDVLNAITAGDLDIGWVAGIQAPGVASGELVNLASGEEKRLEMSPDAMSVKELGMVADFGVYFMYLAPKGLPADAREALTTAIKEIVNDPKSKTNAFITKAFGGPVTISGAELEKLHAEDMMASKKLIEEASK